MAQVDPLDTARWRILQGDCLPLMRDLPDASVHAVVTDPPYGLSEHNPAEVLACLSAWCRGEEYQPTGRGFMGKVWDAWVPGPAYWREALRVLKPGGHLLAFAGARTQDLMGMALRLAGFEIRDCVMWVFGSGFPKSLDISKAIDKAAGAEREVVGTKHVTRDMARNGRVGDEAISPIPVLGVNVPITAPATPAAAQWAGWGTALKPAYEPIIVARKPLGSTVAACVLEHGTGGINIDGCRVGADDGYAENAVTQGVTRAGVDGCAIFGGGAGLWAAPATFSPNAAGRWPANLAHDGSPEVLALFPDSEGQQGALLGGELRSQTPTVYGKMGPAAAHPVRGDSGSAARFYYCAKASKEDRDEGLSGIEAQPQDPTREDGAPGGDNPRNRGAKPRANAHPTVKPTDLMRWLVRLVTPPGGVVLDPFCGSGSTGKAAMLEGFRFIGIEREEASAETARLRVVHAAATPVQLDMFAPAAPVVAPPADDRQSSFDL